MIEQGLPAPEEVDRVLAEIFERPEFTPASPSIWSEILQKLSSWLGKFLPQSPLGDGDGQIIGWAAIILIAVAVVLVLRRFAGARLWAGRRAAGAVESHGDAVESMDGGEAEEWERAALRAAEEGRWREAVLALYQVLLLRLDGVGAVRYDPAKTPGDYRREMRANEAARGLLEAFLRSFEPIAFGGEEPDRLVYERLRADTARVGELV